MVLNFCYQTYKDDKSQSQKSQFKVGKSVIDFKDMSESIGGKVRKIRQNYENKIRIRQDDSDRVKEVVKHKVRRRRNFDTTSFRWLDQNYIRIYGLRNWTWRVIISGIISEHLIQMEKEGQDSEIDGNLIRLIWHMVL